MLSEILGGGFEVARHALNGLSRRQTTIAANVANIDTPGYQRREVTFEDALKTQIGTTRGSLRVTDPRHFSTSTSTGAASGGGQTRDVVAERNDANNVSIDEEMLLLVETQLRYQALAQSTGKRLTTIRTVIRGG